VGGLGSSGDLNLYGSGSFSMIGLGNSTRHSAAGGNAIQGGFVADVTGVGSKGAIGYPFGGGGAGFIAPTNTGRAGGPGGIIIEY
jgi:hypothetical protein